MINGSFAVFNVATFSVLIYVHPVFNILLPDNNY